MSSVADTSHPWITPQQPELLFQMELATPSQIVHFGECPVKQEGLVPKECVSTRWHKDTEMPPRKEKSLWWGQLRVHRSHLQLPQGQFPAGGPCSAGGDTAVTARSSWGGRGGGGGG